MIFWGRKRRAEKINYLRILLSFANELSEASSLYLLFLHRLNLYLNKDLSLSVGVYHLLHKAYKPYPVKLYRETNELVKIKTRMFNAKTGSLLLPSDTKRAQVTIYYVPAFSCDGGEEMLIILLLLVMFHFQDQMQKYLHLYAPEDSLFTL